MFLKYTDGITTYSFKELIKVLISSIYKFYPALVYMEHCSLWLQHNIWDKSVMSEDFSLKTTFHFKHCEKSNYSENNGLL